MAEVSNEVLHEGLKNLQSRMNRMHQSLGDLRQEIVSLRLVQMSVQNDIHNIYGILARNDERIERIESRLDPRNWPEARAVLEHRP